MLLRPRELTPDFRMSDKTFRLLLWTRSLTSDLKIGTLIEITMDPEATTTITTDLTTKETKEIKEEEMEVTKTEETDRPREEVPIEEKKDPKDNKEATITITNPEEETDKIDKIPEEETEDLIE